MYKYTHAGIEGATMQKPGSVWCLRALGNRSVRGLGARGVRVEVLVGMLAVSGAGWVRGAAPVELIQDLVVAMDR